MQLSQMWREHLRRAARRNARAEYCRHRGRDLDAEITACVSAHDSLSQDGFPSSSACWTSRTRSKPWSRHRPKWRRIVSGSASRECRAINAGPMEVTISGDTTHRRAPGRAAPLTEDGAAPMLLLRLELRDKPFMQ
jgi:hypothetical protein